MNRAWIEQKLKKFRPVVELFPRRFAPVDGHLFGGEYLWLQFDCPFGPARLVSKEYWRYYTLMSLCEAEWQVQAGHWKIV